MRRQHEVGWRWELRDRGVLEPVERRVLEVVVPVRERRPLAAIYVLLELRHEGAGVRDVDAHLAHRGERALRRFEQLVAMYLR